MSDVIDLASRRPTVPGDHMRCRCGNVWFTLDGREAGMDQDAGGVVLNHEGRIVAYCGVPRCLECGELAGRANA